MNKIDFQTARIAMVDCQIRPADVTHYNIIEAMLNVPRETFFPEKIRNKAYVGENIKISEERYALDPRLIAKILSLINISESELVLNVGGCYGYLAALLSHFAQAVVMTEEANLAIEAERILVAQSIDNVIVKCGVLSEGAKDYGPYDAIIIEGGVNFVTEEILNQLKLGGRIVAIFINGVVGECRLGFKTSSGVIWRFGFNAAAPILNDFKNESKFIF
tara:strand:+ start:187 stop:843 length:657 start_codon:yes stop_codon:yes gene_type:complete